MFEYAISCGEGTLLDYGVLEEIEFLWIVTRLDYTDVYVSDQIKNGNQTVICAPVSWRCETGE